MFINIFPTHPNTVSWWLVLHKRETFGVDLIEVFKYKANMNVKCTRSLLLILFCFDYTWHGSGIPSISVFWAHSWNCSGDHKRVWKTNLGWSCMYKASVFLLYYHSGPHVSVLMITTGLLYNSSKHSICWQLKFYLSLQLKIDHVNKHISFVLKCWRIFLKCGPVRKMSNCKQ